MEAEQVHRIAGLPDTDLAQLHTVVGHAFVTRQTCRTPVDPATDSTRDWLGVDVFAPLRKQTLAADRWYSIAEPTRAALRDRIDRDGFVPLISTVSGLVALCLEIVEIPTTSGQLVLGTRPAGE